MRDRFTYANVMATVAVFIALGAGAWAAGLPRDSVKAKQIKAGAVRTAELADGAVNSAKVADGSLQAGDFAPGQLPQWPQGPAGADGTNGTDGTNGLDGTARAYATVDPTTCTPICVPTNTKGVGQVKRGATGFYCITVPGISSQTVGAVVTTDSLTTPNPEGNGIGEVRTTTLPTSFGCASDSDFLVLTQYHTQTDVRDAAGTGVTSVAGNATDSNQVGFTIAVP